MLIFNINNLLKLTALTYNILLLQKFTTPDFSRGDFNETSMFLTVLTVFIFCNGQFE